ncbi:MAG TPA: patatin-like phospholipase family protein [Solirubrobacter sp.]
MGPRRHPNRSDASALVGGTAGLLRAGDEVTDPVLRVVVERARCGSRPGERDDEHVVCLAVEGGGMRGAVSAGMCVVLEAAGVVPAFDRIYGVSAGAVNGWATAARQAALGATYYQDAVSGRVIDRMRPLRGGPVIDYDLLFAELIGLRKPLPFEGLTGGPEFRALAISLETMSLRVLRDFGDANDVLQAVRASAALPRLGGRPPTFRGERMGDGGLLEPIPYQTALAEGATHVLVLRSRPAGYRRPRLLELGESLALRDQPGLGELRTARQGVYNRQAAALETMTRERAGAEVCQVAVPDSTRLVGQLEADGARVAQALRLGARAMASALFTDPIDVCWQPVVYRAAPVAEASVDDRLRPPAARWRAFASRVGAHE